MKITVLTLFPELFQLFFSTSIIGRAAQKKLVEFQLIDIRPFGKGKHKVVDERPYGGGAGMILRADTLASALKSIQNVSKISEKAKTKVILTSASGYPYHQKKARNFSKLDHMIIICGHYEGIDQRFIDRYVDEEISIGDYVLTGGEIPAMVVIDSTVRLIANVLKKSEATTEESFSIFQTPSANLQLLEYPQYTRPKLFEKIKVPSVLLSGNHQQIASWRREQSLAKTKRVRPDLLKKSITQKD